MNTASLEDLNDRLRDKTAVETKQTHICVRVCFETTFQLYVDFFKDQPKCSTRGCVNTGSSNILMIGCVINLFFRANKPIFAFMFA